MSIEGQVYDITTHLPMHPSDSEIVLPWCRKEAGDAWRTKTLGRPHSAAAYQLLLQYRIGKLQDLSRNDEK